MAPFSTEEILRAKHMMGYQGLLVANDSDPAYEVHIVSRKIGDSIPTFKNQIQRLTQNDGEGFFPINIQRPDGGGLLGASLTKRETRTLTLCQSLSDTRTARALLQNDLQNDPRC